MLEKPIKIGVYTLVLGSISIILCYHFIDRALVYFVYNHQLRSFPILKIFTYLPSVIHGFMVLLYPLLAIRYCYQRQTRIDQIGFAFANSVAITYYLCGLLKIAFGRYWPETFSCGNPSLLRDHVYGFNFFHSGVAHASFPSGHAAVMLAAATILWIAYPHWRWLQVGLVLLVLMGLLGNYYHFSSDLIAGGMLGFLTAYYTAKVMKLQ